MQQNTNKKTLVIGITIGIAILLVLAVVFLTGKPKGGTGKTTTHTDPTSGQTVVTQEGKAPETNGQKETSPLFLGMDALINIGLSADQVNTLQYAFQQYEPFASGSPQISLDVKNIQQISPRNSGDPQHRWSIKSSIVVNDKDAYNITLYYWDISRVQLYIYNTGGQQLFDSGVLDHSSTIKSGD